LKARWVTLIEKVRLSISIKAQDSKSNKAYKDNKGYKEKRDSVGQNSGVVASNTAHNSGQQKPVSSPHQQNYKSNDTVFPRQIPKSAQSGGARVNSIQQKKNIQFEASVNSGQLWADGTPRTAAQVYNKATTDNAKKNKGTPDQLVTKDYLDQCAEDAQEYFEGYDELKDLDAVNNRFTNNNNNNIFALLDSGSSIHTVPHSYFLTSIYPINP
jgi:hypothetical protein